MATRITRGAAAIVVAAPGIIRHLAALAGAGGIAYGAWLWSEPAGYVVGGALLLCGALLDALGATRR